MAQAVILMMLAIVGDPERVRALAEKGLGAAWQKGLKKLVKAMRGDSASAAALLDGGAHVNAQARRGVTALALAALGGKPELVKLLLERGAEVDARATRGGLFKCLAHLRARHHHKRVVDRRWQRRDAGIRLKAHHLATPGIDREHAPLETMLAHETQRSGRILLFVGRGAYKRDGIGGEQCPGQLFARDSFGGSLRVVIDASHGVS